MPGSSQNAVRRELARELGADELRRLHRPNRLCDAAALVGVPGAALLLGWALWRLPFGVAWVAALVAQGFVLQLFAFLSHDLFLHRRLGGERIAAIGSALFLTPVTIVASAYKDVHLRHHAHVNQPDDTEAYKLDFDRRWKRLLLLTIVGQLLAPRRAFARGPERTPYFALALQNAALVPAIRREQWLIRLWVLAVVVLAVAWPEPVLFGYVLPIFLTLPLASTLRTAIEHAEVDPTNPVFAATYYRTHLLTRLAFFADSGDCHLVHHLYPAIPFYRVGRALAVMRPYFLRHGVVERRSLWALAYGYVWKAYPYRQRWPEVLGDPAPATTSAPSAPTA
jgi:fatty acid desaturase